MVVMIDPENMSYVEWSFFCLAAILIVFFLCRWIDMVY